MRRNLLLGNGINIHLGVKGMSVPEIASRFKKNLIMSSPFYELLFNISFTDEICDKLFKMDNKQGIESLAEKVHSYVIESISQNITINTRMRLLDAIVCTALSAIFYKESKKIGAIYDIAKLPDMDYFDKIFTLNYAEFWDKDKKCIHLHGRYDNSLIQENKKPILLYSMERYRGFENYDKVVTELSDKYNLYSLYTWDIVFSPEFSKKSEMIGLGQYPSNELYPANDLFLRKVKHLYGELNEIKEIEIFGMSPYGDECLIEKINDMEYVTVYVYDKIHNPETEEWKNILKCPYVIKDSFEIMC